MQPTKSSFLIPQPKCGRCWLTLRGILDGGRNLSEYVSSPVVRDSLVRKWNYAHAVGDLFDVGSRGWMYRNAFNCDTLVGLSMVSANGGWNHWGKKLVWSTGLKSRCAAGWLCYLARCLILLEYTLGSCNPSYITSTMCWIGQSNPRKGVSSIA